ncbi:hypothetical protein EHM76_00385 [bacterium]|nr:MAG: hypothetical protein EHM76_00385 [bacterium]
MRTAELNRLLELGLMAGIALAILYVIKKGRLALDFGGEVMESAQFRTANLIETFFPLVDSNSMMTHAVTFPDGSRHAVPGETVDRSGFFLYKGARYRLMTNTQGQKLAITA